MDSALASPAFREGLVKGLTVIGISEIGDKTFFIAALLAMRHPRMTVRGSTVAGGWREQAARPRPSRMLCLRRSRATPAAPAAAPLLPPAPRPPLPCPPPTPHHALHPTGVCRRVGRAGGDDAAVRRARLGGALAGARTHTPAPLPPALRRRCPSSAHLACNVPPPDAPPPSQRAPPSPRSAQIPKVATHYLATGLFFFFGLKGLWDVYNHGAVRWGEGSAGRGAQARGVGEGGGW